MLAAVYLLSLALAGIAAVTGDHLGQEIQWNGKRLAELPLEHFILRLHLENAEVFALTITEDD